MTDPSFTGAPASALICVPLDQFTAVFHRQSGATHLLAEPAPQILAALGGRSMTRDALLDRLAADYDLRDGDIAALDARLRELVAAGLVSDI